VGTVADAASGIVAGASIEAVDQSTGQSRTVRTNEASQYPLIGLAPGVYKISAAATGFRQAVIQRVDVEVAKSYNLNFSLEVGAVSESVEVAVSAAAELQNPRCGRRRGNQWRVPAAHAGDQSIGADVFFSYSPWWFRPEPSRP
jgi:hypothetical protein